VYVGLMPIDADTDGMRPMLGLLAIAIAIVFCRGRPACMRVVISASCCATSLPCCIVGNVSSNSRSFVRVSCVCVCAADAAVCDERLWFGMGGTCGILL